MEEEDRESIYKWLVIISSIGTEFQYGDTIINEIV